MVESRFGKGCHLHLIDGSAFVFRAYHALPPLTRRSDGLPIGAVSGFCNMLLRYIDGGGGTDEPTHVAVVFDKGSQTFRNDIYPEYKANREDMPEELRVQMPLTRHATEAFNIACKELEGYEADDIIATLACQARDAGGRATIISSDKDLMQLIGDGIEMYDAMKDKRFDADGVREKFGVGPELMVDLQALAGDSTDNVPGAPGIGVKIAAGLLERFGSLDELLDRAEEITQPKRRQTLIDCREQIEISRKLVRLDRNTPLDFALEDLEARPPEPGALLEFLVDMGFRSITRRVAERFGVEAPESRVEGAGPFAAGKSGSGGGRDKSGGAGSGDSGSGAAESASRPAAARSQSHSADSEIPFDASAYQTVLGESAQSMLEDWVERIRAGGVVAVDTETTGLDEMQADLVGISLCVEPGRACYVPIAHKGGGAVADGADSALDSGDRSGDGEPPGGLFGGDELSEGQLSLEAALETLRPVLEDPAIMKVGQNIKYDVKILARHGIDVAPVDDTMLISYAQHGGLHGHGMDALSDRYLGHEPIPIKPLLGSGKSARTFDKVPIEAAAPYAAEDADVTLRLWRTLKPRLVESRVATVYETLERPMIPVLASMEMEGIEVDRVALSRQSGAFAQKMAGLESEIHDLAGEHFNVGSPKQLGEILFDRMGLPGGKKGKTGAYATGADILEDLATEHELPARVLDWRQLSKLKSTYTDALQEHVNPDTGRVHTSFSIAGASTGRLASTDPNLQNIPVRTEDGRRIREAFVARKGHLLVSLDYSQIELRILAHVAGIDALKKAFAEGQDIHAMTASEMFGVPVEGMPSDVRRRAKAINFGVIYGISGFGLARNLRIPRAEANAFIERYFERFPGIRGYMEETKAFAKENGYVQTLFGRRIHTPEIGARGPRAAFAQRAAINAPIQGSAADVIRRAMIRMPAAIEGLPAKMLLQVHDELLFEVKKSAVDDLIARAKDVMEGAAHPAAELDVPLVVDSGKGANWSEAH